jgi:hypothetical protein
MDTPPIQSLPVDFYVTGDSTINAFSIASEDAGHPHIVNVNSELFNLMSEDELRFVIGHELGHLINQDTALKRLIYFVYPPQTTTPPVTLQFKIHLHDDLAMIGRNETLMLKNTTLILRMISIFDMFLLKRLQDRHQ